MRPDARPGLVAVHSPLVGPSTWRAVAEVLAGRGWSVEVPSLLGAWDEGPPYGDALVRPVEEHLRPSAGTCVVLLVHSGAGSLVPQLVGAGQGRVGGVVLVDALLPHPGRAWVGTAPTALVEDLRARVDAAGRLPPWTEWFPPDAIAGELPDAQVRDAFVRDLPRVPWSWLEEPAPALDVDVAAPAAPACAYVRLSDGYEPEAAEAEHRGWPVVRRLLGHLAPLTHAPEVAEVVESALERVSAPDGTTRIASAT